MFLLFSRRERRNRMIVDFTVENYGPFKDRTTLSMQAAGIKGLPGNISESKFVKHGLLTSAIVFGANASGKSYLTNAILALKMAVLDTYRDGMRFPWYEPFRLTTEGASSPVRMRIRFVYDDVLYDYAVSYSADSIVEESLHHYPHGRRSCVFRRTGPDTFDRARNSIARLTNRSSTYLAAASKLNDGVCGNVSRYLRDRIMCIGSDMTPWIVRTCRCLSENPGMRETAITGFGYAGFGITGFQWTEGSVDAAEPESRMDYGVLDKATDDTEQTIRKMGICMRHAFGDPDNGGFEALIPLETESPGTQRMFGLIGPLADVLANGGVLVIDDFGSGFHPMLSRWMVSQFSNQDGDSKAQLIANSHELELMDTDEVLRRDQIWFANKDMDTGAAELYALSDFDGVRKKADIAKAYLNGRYGAVPRIISGKIAP